MQIVIPAAILGAMGLIFGVGLGIFAKVFAVKVDERAEAIRETLPGANCGGCGFPGCDGYAKAVAAGDAPPNACTVGGNRVAARVADIMGIQAEAVEERVATVLCRGDDERCQTRFHYQGIADCRAATNVLGGFKSCPYACLGLGSCRSVCQFGAITIEDHFVHIDPEKCTACGACERICPKQVIRMHPKGESVAVRCHSAFRGKVVMENCSAGCIGCGKCARSCKFGAIVMENNLPVIAFAKCVGCQECARGCPTGAMSAMRERLVADIDEPRCTACGKCREACKFEALSDSPVPEVYQEACTGCGECRRACPEDCIEIRERSSRV